MTAENRIASHALLATNRLRAFSFFSPNFWATGMAKPLHTPRQKPIIIKLTEPVDPTAARALTPRHLPTMMVSAILYSCWNSSPHSMGMKNPSISFTGEPSVISFVTFAAMYVFLSVSMNFIPIMYSLNLQFASRKYHWNPGPGHTFYTMGRESVPGP